MNPAITSHYRQEANAQAKTLQDGHCWLLTCPVALGTPLGGQALDLSLRLPPTSVLGQLTSMLPKDGDSGIFSPDLFWVNTQYRSCMKLGNRFNKGEEAGRN